MIKNKYDLEDWIGGSKAIYDFKGQELISVAVVLRGITIYLVSDFMLASHNDIWLLYNISTSPRDTNFQAAKSCL